MHSLSVPTVSKIEKGNSQSIIILRWKENRALFVALINLADSESIISYAKNGTQVGGDDGCVVPPPNNNS